MGMKLLLTLLVVGTVLATEQTTETFFEEKPTSTDVTNFLIGLFKGLNEKGDAKDLLKCTKNMDVVLFDIIKAIKIIGKLDIKNMKAGIMLLYEAVTLMLRTLEPCFHGLHELKTFALAFFKTNIFQMAMKFIRNPAPYIESILYCLQGFMDKNYEEAGEYLGKFLYRLIMVNEAFWLFDDRNKTAFEVAYELFQGFIDGLNAGGQIHNLDQCIDEFPELVKEINHTIDVIKQIEWKNFEKALGGVHTLLGCSAKILLNVKPCSKSFGDVSFLWEKFGDVNTEELLARVTKNSLKIIHCFTQAIKILKTNDYKACAQQIGDIFYLIVLSN